MVEIEIPGFAKFHFAHLVLDVNGTIAKDGQLLNYSCSCSPNSQST